MTTTTTTSTSATGPTAAPTAAPTAGPTTAVPGTARQDLTPVRRPRRGRVEPASLSLRCILVASVAGLPLLVPTGPGNTSPADLPILLAIGGVVLWLSRNRVRLHVPYALGVWLLLLAGAVAAFTHQDVGSTAVLAQDLFLLVWGGAVASAVRADRSLLRLVCASWSWTAAVCAGLLVVGRLAGIAWLAGQTLRDGSRSALTFGDPNLAGNYFVVSLFLVLASRYPRRRLPRAGVVALLLLAILFTGSNGAMVSTLVGLGVAAVVGAWRSRGALAALGVACVLALGASLLVTSVDWASLQARAAAGPPVLHDSVGRGDSSSQDRQVLFHEGVKLFWNGNLVGIGAGRTKEALAAQPAPYIKEAHNDYVATLVELGLVGGVGLVVLLATVATRLARVAGRRGRRDSRTRDLLPSPHFLVAAAAAFLVSGMFYEVLHFRHLWAFLGLVAGLDLLGGDPSEPAPLTTGRR
ncbi:O-antigen ligase family protein [Terrabacter sp. NPDC080008]|uniref:O-antigen ligase family protein n=1 Tax=Terrabacter sp. NPDC080008 TaxID=3155176 RepID=UPI00344D7D51